MQRFFGSRLQAVRRGGLQQRVTQDALAEALEVSRTSVSNIERGRHRVFLDQVYAAAHALGVEVTELLPTMEEVFPDAAISTAGGMRARDARQVGAMIDTLRERAVREVEEAQRSGTTANTSKRSM